jgi:hypothetical protein
LSLRKDPNLFLFPFAKDKDTSLLSRHPLIFSLFLWKLVTWFVNRKRCYFFLIFHTHRTLLLHEARGRLCCTRMQGSLWGMYSNPFR